MMFYGPAHFYDDDHEAQVVLKNAWDIRDFQLGRIHGMLEILEAAKHKYYGIGHHDLQDLKYNAKVLIKAINNGNYELTLESIAYDRVESLKKYSATNP